MRRDKQVRKAKKNTYFSIVVTFIVGIIFTLLTSIPGPWDDWVEEKKEERSAKK